MRLKIGAGCGIREILKVGCGTERGRLVLPLWTKVVCIRHTTKTKILTGILNSEFGTSVIYYRIFQQ